jgi:hypothetical protein
MKNRDCLLCPEPAITAIRALVAVGERIERAVPRLFNLSDTLGHGVQ